MRIVFNGNRGNGKQLLKVWAFQVHVPSTPNFLNESLIITRIFSLPNYFRGIPRSCGKFSCLNLRAKGVGLEGLGVL